MTAVSIILFLLYTWGFGFGLGSLVKEPKDFLEKNLMRIGIGLGAMLTLGLLFNLIKIPLDWRIFLLASLITISVRVYINLRKKEFALFDKKNFSISIYSLIMLVLFSITFYMYGTGAFAYPYLEDDDSWSHAMGAKYVAVQKTVFAGVGNPLNYIDPYPPAYDLLFGILHQTNDFVYWTLKFFNAFIISLSIIFFYFFVKNFTNSSKKALFSTFALFAIPGYLSHFIWAIALTMPLFFVSFYAVEKIKDDKRWWIIGAVVIAATVTSSPTHSAYFGSFFLIYLMGKTIVERKFLRYEFLAGFIGLMVSFGLWWLPMTLNYGGLSGLAYSFTGDQSVVGIAGTADRIYSMSDFIYAKGANLVNNPIGIGFVVSLLVIVALISILHKNYSKSKKHILKISIMFIVVAALFLFFLSSNYVKFVEKRNVMPLEKGSVPFLEFLSDQSFVVYFLLILIFVLVLLIAVNYKKEDPKDNYLVIVLLWMIFSFYAVNAGPFVYKISPFRAWIIFAIPVALLSGEAINYLFNFAKALAGSFTRSKILTGSIALIFLVIIGYGIITTSFVQKYAVNTAQWPPGGFWTSNEEIGGYIWFKDNIPPDTRVFTFSNNALILGLDKFICHWCDDVRDYQKNGFDQTIEQTYDWLKKGQYKYIIIDGQTARKFGANETSNKIQELAESGNFNPIFDNNGIVIFSIV